MGDRTARDDFVQLETIYNRLLFISTARFLNCNINRSFTGIKNASHAPEPSDLVMKAT